MLTGEKLILRTTISAVRALCARGDGMTGILNGLNRYNLPTYVAVMAAGLDLRTTKQIEDVEDRILDEGMDRLAPVLLRYAGYIVNGGREPGGEAEEEERRSSGNS